MSAFKRLIGGCVFVFSLLTTTAFAQEVRAPISTEREPVAAGAPLVTATATAQRVRFAAPGTVIQLRLEVYNEAGQKVFDTELRGGNVLDWQLQDGAGQRVTAGAYASVLTIKSLSGRLSQRVGSVMVNEKTAVLEAIGVTQLTAGQQQSIGPVESGSGLKVLQENEAATLTAVMHDGTDGQLSRTRGALSFRLGDFFGGTDTEQMRLTEEGNLGVGIAKPQAKLDVAGVIRTSEGIEFATGTDGTDAMKITKLSTTATGGLQQTLADGTVVPNATGTGTQNRLAKWTDNAGTLGDSVVNDTGTGLQLTAPPSPVADTNLLYLNSTNGTTGVLAGSAPSYGANNGPFFAMRGNTYTTIPNQRGIFTISAGNVSSPGPLEGVVKFNTGADQVRMLITATGDIGIGTTAPTAKLDVTGHVNTSTQYNIGGGRVLSTPGADNLFVGLFAGTDNTGGSDNSFFGSYAGNFNKTGTRNSIFGSRAGVEVMDNGDNSFFGANAGGRQVQGSGNSYFGSQAGSSSRIGNNNSYFGYTAGSSSGNGSNNSFVGATAGHDNLLGSNNVFLGFGSGYANRHGMGNTIIGADANVGALDLSNATAIGYRAEVAVSNALVLGSIFGQNDATADTNVGIGTTAPTRKLHLSGVGSDGAGQTDLRITGTGAIASGITLESTGTGGRTYSWLSTADNTGGGGSGPGRLAVFDVTAGLYRMVIDGTGNVGIGTFTPAHKLHVNGSVAGNGPYTNLSDARFKKNIHPLSGALSKVLRLRGVSFDWRSDEFPDLNFNQGRQIGFIAQETAGVLPEAVTTDNQGYYRMAYAEVTPILVEAIKEQQQTITKLQQENNKLKVRNADTEARLAVLESSVKRIAHRSRQQRRRQ
jgi:hypothetical protein